ncbi:hypothetical protein HYV85_01340 [Candidatus Woesearchaeota archaeon]|nr:hypothetical protein [Candidatus Woesearchaeota archaeon]
MVMNWFGGRQQAPQGPTVEQGIQAMVEGILMAVDHVAANGQNVTNVANAPYWNVTLPQPANYQPTNGSVVTEQNSEVYHPQQTIIVPEARSAFSPAAWNTASQNAENTATQSLDTLVIQPRGSIADALTRIADEAGLRQMGAQQAMQTVQQLVGTLNATGNMRTTLRPNELYNTLRLFTNLIELMRPQAAVGAQAQQAHQFLFADLQQRLATNQFMAQRTQPVQYQLLAQTAAAVVLAQYAIR